MKINLIFFSTVLLMVTLISACSPDDAETPVENQYKPLKIVVTFDDVIHAPSSSQAMNILSVGGTATMSLNGSVPSNVGQNTIEYNGTATTNTQVLLILSYLDQLGYTTDPNTGAFTVNYDCDEVKVSIYHDDVLKYQDTKELGSNDGTCQDAGTWSIQYTL
jgi:hypothetical protein